MTEFANWQQRTLLQVGENNLKQLNQSHILVVGLGGVGSYAAEMLCRAGIGEITIVDHDTIHPTNINRQLLALHSTIGRKKTEVLAERLMDINPQLKLHSYDWYIKDEKALTLLENPYHYIVDAIDTLSPKVFLIYHALKKGFRLVSSMGAGGKYDPSLIKVADIAESYNCKFARIVRKRLHKLGIHDGFKVVFSPEEVNENRIILTKNEPNKNSIVGTISYMPAIFGCYCASVVIRDLLE